MQSVRVLPTVVQAHISTLVRGLSGAAGTLLSIQKVQIKDGKSPYLLLTVYNHGETKYGRHIVRGWNADQHDSIYQKVNADMKKLGLCIKANGGGYINNDGQKKHIKIYGACSVHGRANHMLTKEILESWPSFRGYKVEVTDKIES